MRYKTPQKRVRYCVIVSRERQCVDNLNLDAKSGRNPRRRAATMDTSTKVLLMNPYKNIL
jgi:hypothetical protein